MGLPAALGIPAVPAPQLAGYVLQYAAPPCLCHQPLPRLAGLQTTQELEKVLADVGDPPSSLEDR